MVLINTDYSTLFGDQYLSMAQKVGMGGGEGGFEDFEGIT